MSRPARIALALLLMVAWGGCSVVRPAPRAVAVPGPTRYVLPNGVPLIIEEHRASDVVALQLWVQGGARDETASDLGLAHYLEHMVFKGTPTRPAGFVEREVEGVGGRINAGTSWDYTFYHTVLPARQAEAGIAMLVDVGVNASLEANLLEAEKQVVLEEMRLNEDNPRRFLVRELFSSAFEGHPYGRPVIGTSEVITGLTRETLVSFYRRHYMPEMFALVVVGAVTGAELKRAITAAEVEHEFSMETAEGRARAYGQAETIWRLEEELLYLDRVRSVNAAQVQAVARRYLDLERYVRVALLPQ